MLFVAIMFLCESECDDHALKLKSANQRYMIETIFLSMYLGKYKNAVHSLFFIEWMWYFINFSFWLDGIVGLGSWKMDFECEYWFFILMVYWIVGTLHGAYLQWGK